MRFIVINSGSIANGYVLTNDNEALVIEMGVPLMGVKKTLDFNTSIISGAIGSHRHLDHTKYIKQYADAGIDVYVGEDVLDHYNLLTHNRAKIVEDGKRYQAGRFKIMAFAVDHDVPCFGYLINHPDTGIILFATDTYMLNYEFKNLSHVLLEANYCDTIVQSNIDTGRLHPLVRNRVFNSHIELQTCKQILSDSDLSKVQEIVLIHLSDGNSDAERFIQEIGSATGKPIYVADKGLVLDFTKI